MGISIPCNIKERRCLLWWLMLVRIKLTLYNARYRYSIQEAPSLLVTHVGWQLRPACVTFFIWSAQILEPEPLINELLLKRCSYSNLVLTEYWVTEYCFGIIFSLHMVNISEILGKSSEIIPIRWLYEALVTLNYLPLICLVSEIFTNWLVEFCPKCNCGDLHVRKSR